MRARCRGRHRATQRHDVVVDVDVDVAPLEDVVPQELPLHARENVAVGNLFTDFLRALLGLLADGLGAFFGLLADRLGAFLRLVDSLAGRPFGPRTRIDRDLIVHTRDAAHHRELPGARFLRVGTDGPRQRGDPAVHRRFDVIGPEGRVGVQALLDFLVDCVIARGRASLRPGWIGWAGIGWPDSVQGDDARDAHDDAFHALLS